VARPGAEPRGRVGRPAGRAGISDRFERIRRVLEPALDLEGDRLAAFLDEACGGDADLRHDVEELLAERDDVPSVLRTAGAESFVNATGEEVPDTVGPFRIVGRLGEGGMGSVYLAEQEEPIRRRVALKLIKPGLDTRAVIARFEAERQTLARLQHPNIAQVHDAGTTERGHPYFAMEYVPGVAITRFCELERLGLRDRLRLFATVCGAIHHAHQRGVIHRDIKPSNVLVTLVEGEPVPKVIDFGIAKATAGPSSEGTAFTVPGQIVGTPEYMSPEQADPTATDLDVTTDVYSLGALLYELITGSPPFESTTLRAGGLEEARRRIREEEPPRPSRRTAIRHVRGDLDWITMRALEKDRRRRYSSAAELRAEIERYLRGEPVLAGPPSATYRFGKLVRRHRVAFAGIAGVFVAMAIGLTVSTTLYFRAETAREEAARQARRSERVNDFLVGMLRSADPEIGRRDMTVLEVLDASAERIDEELADDLDVRAAAHSNLGNTYDALGRYEEAVRHLRAAVELHREMYPPGHPEIGVVLSNLGLALSHAGRYEEAEESLRESLAIAEASNLDAGRAASVRTNLAVLLKDLGRYEEAEPLYREALAMDREEYGESARVMRDLSNLAVLYRRRGRSDEAIELLREAISMARRLGLEEEPDAVMALGNLATALYGAGRDEEAEPVYRQSIERKRRVFGEDHPNVAQDLSNLSVLLWRTGERARAESTAVEALAIMRRALGPDHPETASCLFVLASMRTAAGRPAEAEAALREALRIFRANLPAEHADVIWAQARLGNCLSKLGRREEAERELVAAQEAAARAGSLSSGQQRRLLEWLEALYEDWRPERAAAVRAERERLR
jgi:non-specific serine/threonine protein kinase/serine/threonine-protein kinase